MRADPPIRGQNLLNPQSAWAKPARPANFWAYKLMSKPALPKYYLGQTRGPKVCLTPLGELYKLHW